MIFNDQRYSRALLCAWVVGVFAVSAITDVGVLAAASVLALAIFARGAWRVARRLALSVVPVTATLCVLSWAWLALVTGRVPDGRPFAALMLRAVLIAFITFSVLGRVDLFKALAPWPALARLSAITLAQIKSVKLLVSESLLGLRSRLARKPGAREVVRGAGGITAALLVLSVRNSRDIGDAMRSRGALCSSTSTR